MLYSDHRGSLIMNFNDEDLFKDAMEDVTPLRDRSNILWLKSPSTKSPRQREEELQLDNPLTSGFLTLIPRETPLEYKKEGIQQGVLDKLRLGKYQLDASLNLLRQPVETCRRSLYAFMLQETGKLPQFVDHSWQRQRRRGAR